MFHIKRLEYLVRFLVEYIIFMFATVLLLSYLCKKVFFSMGFVCVVFMLLVDLSKNQAISVDDYP